MSVLLTCCVSYMDTHGIKINAQDVEKQDKGEINMKELLKLKSILSLMFCGVTCFLAVTNTVSVDAFMGLTSAIVTYYFTRKEA